MLGNKMEQKCFTPGSQITGTLDWSQYKLAQHQLKWTSIKEPVIFQDCRVFFHSMIHSAPQTSHGTTGRIFQMGSFPLDSTLADLLQNLFLTPPFVFKVWTIIPHYSFIFNCIYLSLVKWEFCTYMSRKGKILSLPKRCFVYKNGIQITEISKGSEILLCTHHSCWGQKPESLDQSIILEKCTVH